MNEINLRRLVDWHSRPRRRKRLSTRYIHRFQSTSVSDIWHGILTHTNTHTGISPFPIMTASRDYNEVDFHKKKYSLFHLTTKCTNLANTFLSFIILSLIFCNGYRRRKWIRRYEFKSWTRLIAFHIALILLGKVWIRLFSLQLWVNSRAD